MKALQILLLILLLPVITPSQLFEENFDYSLSKLIAVSSSWSESPTGSVDIQVVSGNLSYTDYPSSNIGNMIFLDGGASGRSGIRRSFTQITGNGNTVYCSFLLSAVDLNDLGSNLSSGDYFCNFETVSSTIKCYVYVRLGSTASTLNFGLAKSSSSSLTWINTDYNFADTHLLVMAYSFQSGDDAVKLWIDPDLSGSEPVPDVQVTSGTDADAIMYIQYRQRTASGNFNVDGIRVSTSWANAPLPVELTSFSANVLNNQVLLDWRTATEVNNYGFEIQRKIRNFIDWEKIGFVFGFGNSNSPHHYYFTDYKPYAGTNVYRLKQIDNDGHFEYSEEVEINFKSEKEFILYPNYPNPFNPTTKISFYLKASVKLSIALFNLLGEEIRKIYDMHLFESGHHTFVIDGSDLPSGVYLMRIRGRRVNAVSKLILSK